MSNVEVVANIQDLVSNLEPVIATQIMANIDRANYLKKNAEEIYSLLTSGRLVKPKMNNRKTIAVSGNIATISGWDSLNLKWKQAIKQNKGISLEQDESKVKEYYKKFITVFNQYGYYVKVWELDPKQDPGKHYRSHAEKQISVIQPDSSIGVSRGVCEEDCYPYFYALAQIRQQDIVIADPNGIWLFYSHGQVKFVYHVS
ncbi:hypothetical protein NIES4071_72120 [Calothrix sp. NIES-4071]|nr:hypothetical protein NIES4071_72120 [Calothrix sp. NIES-4071]BAZ61487.1 hypothetical protein NIES4105_72070 [Calothrix sp. NIES-4105]